MRRFEYAAAIVLVFVAVHFLMKYAADYAYIGLALFALGVFAYYRIPWGKVRFRLRYFNRKTNEEHRKVVQANLISRK